MRTPARNKGRPAARPAATAPHDQPLVVVGIGASAGGLEAFSELLGKLPADPGAALVFVQHLAPHFESALPALLAMKTRLPVEQAVEGVRLERNRVYVIPPNMHMSLRDGKLHLVPRPADRTRSNAIDLFLTSMAQQCGKHCVGVILSGTASDGASGMREIKAAGGITLVQDPEAARYDSMPRAAIATGAVDLILPIDEIAAEIARITREPYTLRAGEDADGLEISEPNLQRVFALLRHTTGVDFTRYKTPTIRRRLHRRMVLQKLSNMDQYVRFIQQHPVELQNLYDDMLINVTRFFREPESYESLRQVVFPEIVKHQTDDQAIRIWVPGCATGEEAYSVVIALLEFLGDRANNVPIQLFATDISDRAIEHARNGVYSPAIKADVSPERLRRFFTQVDGQYRVNKTIRERCVFARQDLTRDPPFSRLDLIVCRNVLIYLGAALQRKLMSIFHYALRPWGFLALGSAETVGSHAEGFAVADKRHRIYRRKSHGRASALHFPMEYADPQPLTPRRPNAPVRAESTAQNDAARVLLERYSPPAVLVDDGLQIIQFRGQTGAYLEPAPGEATLNLLKMAREGLLHALRSAIEESRRSESPVRKEGLKVKANGGARTVNIQVLPLAASANRHFLIAFEEVREVPRQERGRAPQPASRARRDDRLVALENELKSSREYLQSVIQDLEAANEELQSANEEILSSNEELQSTNEELDTAKEELQSTNEELNTVNEELHARNEETTRINSDLMNLLGSVDIAIVMVASDLRIRRFTPTAEKVLNLIPTDVGRPISQIKPNIDCPELEKIITRVIETIAIQEREVRDDQGNWYSLRVRPYKDVDNRIDGAVLALIDTSVSKREQAAIQAAWEYINLFLETVPAPLALLDAELRVQRANTGFYEALGLNGGEQVLGRSIAELHVGESAANLNARLRAMLDNGSVLDEFPFTSAQGRPWTVRGRVLPVSGKTEAAILLHLDPRADSA